jgi:hypothetical protein
MTTIPAEDDMLKDFIFCEMIHDFKTERKKRPKGEVIGADVINYARYSFYEDRFSKILNSGIDTTSISSYNDVLHCSSDNVEDVLLRYIANTGSENLQDFIKKQVKASGIVDTQITTRATTTNKAGFIYNVMGIEKNKITSGKKLYDIIMSKSSTTGAQGKPIFLLDTGNIIRDLKKGKAEPTIEAYIFSPLVTMSDPAGGLDPIDGLSTSNNKIRFATSNNQIGKTKTNFTGIRLNNVYSTSDYTVNHGSHFFSNFEIKISYDYSVKKVKQKWTYNGPIGVGPPHGYKYQKNAITYEWYADSKTVNKTSFPNTLYSHTFEPADILNSQPNCFNFIRQYINEIENPKKPVPAIPPKIGYPGNSRWLQNHNRIMHHDVDDNRVALALALQRKRAGDWLPVSYILDYDTIKQGQSLTQKNWDNSAPKAQKVAETKFVSSSFAAKDMYIVTIDRPLVAYCLFRGVNVIYYMNNFGPVVFKR